MFTLLCERWRTKVRRLFFPRFFFKNGKKSSLFFLPKNPKKFTGTVEVDPDGSSTVELREGDTYAMRYAAARSLLADEWVALV